MPIAGWAGVVRIWVDDQVGIPVIIKSGNPRWEWQTTGYTGTKPEYGPDVLEFAPLPPIPYILTVPGLPAHFEFELLPGTVTEIVFEPAASPATSTPTPIPTATEAPAPTFTPTATSTPTFVPTATETSTPTPTLTPLSTGPVETPTATPQATATATATSTATATNTPTPTFTPTPLPSPTFSPTPTPGWHVRIPSNVTVPGNWFAIIRVSVEGRVGMPVRITIITDDTEEEEPWSTTCLTGTKPEYGPYFCEFSPLIPAQYIISLEAFDIATTVEVGRSGVAVVIFEEY